MGKVVPFNKSAISKLSDKKIIEIEKDLMKAFNEAAFTNDGDTTIHQAKECAIKEIAKKHNFTIEQAKKFVWEMQLRKKDENL